MTNLENAKLVFGGNAVELSILGSVALVKIDCKDNAKVNLLSAEVMAELQTVAQMLASPKPKFWTEKLTGVVFYSGKADCFIAGADIKEILKAQETPVQQVHDACQLGKQVLDLFANLDMRTVCAVNGRCLGGGMEAFLRFRYRIATKSPKTVFGLPEVGLGVIPGWGGCVMLPKMVGYKTAAWAVLNPLKPWSAQKAAKLGVVHEVVSEEELLARAIEIAAGKAEPKPYKPCLVRSALRGFTDSGPGRSLTRIAFAPLTWYISRYFGAAPSRVLQVMEESFTRSEFDAMWLESRSFAELSHGKGCKVSVKRFLDRKKKS